jgi:hypothetical protein
MLLLPFNPSLVASSIFIIEDNRRLFFSFPGSAWECLNPRLCLAGIGRQSLRICVPRQSLETRGNRSINSTKAEPINEGIGGSASRK